ncbi:hypothetical protein CCM_06492 [Cordyceps militaris CM01]|uniref:Uncharacterized protein n=1 Tax=Cordyceps militaris (strain CM01) TaxID=983644 RepID=G3JMN6_CORMM|nr:uncharacterized protein CCM_06492 [Cordyceps militaris CM01]EGX90072.1 hypothetical protein CCM_06492 [Cordyceps militaris CM01]
MPISSLRRCTKLGDFAWPSKIAARALWRCVFASSGADTAPSHDEHHRPQHSLKNPSLGGNKTGQVGVKLVSQLSKPPLRGYAVIRQTALAASPSNSVPAPGEVMGRYHGSNHITTGGIITLWYCRGLHAARAGKHHVGQSSVTKALTTNYLPRLPGTGSPGWNQNSYGDLWYFEAIPQIDRQVEHYDEKTEYAMILCGVSKCGAGINFLLRGQNSRRAPDESCTPSTLKLTTCHSMRWYLVSWIAMRELQFGGDRNHLVIITPNLLNRQRLGLNNSILGQLHSTSVHQQRHTSSLASMFQLLSSRSSERGKTPDAILLLWSPGSHIYGETLLSGAGALALAIVDESEADIVEVGQY